MTQTLSTTAPLFAYLHPPRRRRVKTPRQQLEQQVAELQRQLNARDAKLLDKARQLAFNANPICTGCGCEMTIRSKQKNTVRMVDGKLVCATCVEWKHAKGGSA